MDNQYVERQYRSLHKARDLQYFNISFEETDLAIGVDAGINTDSLKSLGEQQVKNLRADLEDYIFRHPEFKTSLQPIKLLPDAPQIALIMARAAEQAGVGPMAAVAGALGQSVGEKIKDFSDQVIIENGGDIYVHTTRERIAAVFAGQSKFSYRIGIRINPRESPVGICTSSGTVGHSLSFGRADAAVVKGYPVALADAVATQAGNLVKTEDDLIKAVNYAKNITGVTGILVIKEEKMAAWGEIELVPLQLDRRK